MGDRLRLRDDGLVWREVEHEIVAVDMRTSRYLAVNQTGATLWPTLAQGATKQELVDALAGRFGLEHNQAERDVEAFIAMLREQDLLAADEA